MNTVTLILLVAGVLLLVAGRKAIWFFLGLVAFAAALTLLPRSFPSLEGTTLLLVSAVVGVLAGVLAATVAKVAVWVGGFIGGGYAAVVLWESLSSAAPAFPWIPFLVGGILGLLIARFLFDLALVLVSSVAGAAVIVHALGLEGTAGLVLLIVLAVVGIALQGRRWLKRSSPSSDQAGGKES